MIDIIFILQFFIPVILVIILTLVSENSSPKIAGILSGFPLGTAVILFFIGVDNGGIFASESALNALSGISASLFMFNCYYLSRKIKFGPKVVNSILLSIVGFLVAASLLRQIEMSIVKSLMISFTSILFFSSMFSNIDNVKIKDKVLLSFKVILVRGCIAGFTTICIVSLSSIIGSQSAGILSSFPTTLLPLVVITELTYGKQYAHTIIKNFAYGSGCLACYTFSVFTFYPKYGVYVGTILSFLVAIAYLCIFLYITTYKQHSPLTNESSQ